MTETTIDRPIEGDITRSGRSRTEQGSAAEFLEAIDALLAVDGVEGVVWDQYTPYFNDGDPCEFTTGEVRAILAERFGEEDGDYEKGFASYDLHGYGTLPTPTPPAYILTDGTLTNTRPIRGTNFDHNPARQAWQHAYYADENVVFAANGEDAEAIYKALRGVNLARFEDVVRDNFGDHAEVTATTDGFAVEFYEHD